MTARAAESQLDRAIGPWALGANAVNCTVGVGIFALPAVVAAILGPAAILAYLLCAALIVCVLACFAEVGSTVSRSGGAVAYAEEAFGPLAGFLTWVFLIIVYEPAADAAIAVIVVRSVAGLVSALDGGVARGALLLAIFGGLVAINVRGVRQGIAFSIATTVAKLAPLVLLVIVGAFAIHPSNLAWHGLPKVGAFGTAALTLFFAFGGIETALTPSGEVRDPARTVPRGVFGAVVAVVALYVALQLVAQGTLGGDLASQTANSLAAAGGRVMGGVGSHILLVGAVISGFGAMAGDVLCSPRAFLPIAERGLLPRALATIHPRYHTPWVAIVVYGALGFTLAVSGGFATLAVLASMALLVVYLMVCLASIRLRYVRAPVAGAFRSPGGPTLALLGSATVIWLLAHSTWGEAAAVGGVIAASGIYYGIRARYAAVHEVTHE